MTAYNAPAAIAANKKLASSGSAADPYDCNYYIVDNIKAIYERMDGTTEFAADFNFKPGAGNDFKITLGDAAGSDKISILDSAPAEVASIDSDGNSEFKGIMTISGAVTDGILMTGACTDGIHISGNCTYAIHMTGTIDSGCGIYAVHSQANACYSGIWYEIASTDTNDDFSVIRGIGTSNSANTGNHIRAIRGQAKCGASKYADLLEGGSFEVDYSAGSCDVLRVCALAAHISQGASLANCANLYVAHLRAQTRGDESISTDDVILRLENEAVGGNGRQMDSAIQVVDTTLSGGIIGFGYGIDMSGATIATADIRLQNGETISNVTDGAITISGTLNHTSVLELNSAANSNMTFDAGDDFEFRDTDDSDAVRMKLISASGRLFTWGRMYPGTDSAIQSSRYIYDDGSYTAISHSLKVYGGDMVFYDPSDSAYGPSFRFIQDSDSPANNDRIMRIFADGNDDDDNVTEFIEVRGLAANVADGSETAEYQWHMINSGAKNKAIYFTAAGEIFADTDGGGGNHISTFDVYDDELLTKQVTERMNMDAWVKAGIAVKDPEHQGGYMVSMQKMNLLSLGLGLQAHDKINRLIDSIEESETLDDIKSYIKDYRRDQYKLLGV